MAVVLSVQTGGFSSDKVTPIVTWPKVKRVQRRRGVNKKEAAAAGKKDD